MIHKKTALAAVAALATLGGTALASTSESAHSFVPPNAPAGYLDINKTTCKFVHREIDVAPSPRETYARAEDSRDDVKLACLTNRRTPMPSLHYLRVQASGTGQTVTAGCPSRFRVVGGGSQSEIAGSYPATNQTWSVTRDHLSPRNLTAYAVCIRVG